jgi:hypothetical protein
MVIKAIYLLRFPRHEKLRNVDRLSIPVDVHLQKLAFRTGMVKADQSEILLDINDTRSVVNEAFSKAASSLDKLAIELDEPGWHIGKFCCSKNWGEFSCNRCGQQKSSLCPIADVCDARCPLSETCGKKLQLKLIRAGNVLDHKVKYSAQRISELRDLYPAIQAWLKHKALLWIAEWPLDSEAKLKLDYLAYDRDMDRLIAIEGIMEKPETYLNKLELIRQMVDEPYVATEWRKSQIIDYASKLGFGVLEFKLEEPEPKLIRETYPKVTGPRSLQQNYVIKAKLTNFIELLDRFKLSS